jgi:hypothetical protein
MVLKWPTNARMTGIRFVRENLVLSNRETSAAPRRNSHAPDGSGKYQ